MSDLAAKLARLTPGQRALLARKMAREQDAREIPKRVGEGPAPLSHAQRRIWFVQSLDPASTAYNLGVVLRLRGPIDPMALPRAFDRVTARHEVLRSRYLTDAQGAPLQELATAPPLSQIDLSAEPAPEVAAQAHLRNLIGTPYDLTQVPFRPALLRLAADHHILALGLHHIAADRWSLGVLIRELALAYNGAYDGAADTLRPVVTQMADVATWEQSQDGPRIAAQLDWWRSQLAGAPQLDLPRDHRPTPEQVPQGAVHAFAFDTALTARARAFAQEHGVSLYILTMAAFSVLLSRYADSDDIIFGTDVSNRDRAETQNMMGPLVNTLVLRADLTEATFRDVLHRIAAEFSAALAHRDVPFDQVVEALNPDRLSDDMIPLFRARFDLQQAEALPRHLNGLDLERLPHTPTAPKYELRMNLEDDGTCLTGRIEYRGDLYDATTISRLATHYLRLLGALLDAPDAPVAHAPILSEAEEAELLALGQGAEALPHGETLAGAFEAQVDAAPDAPALFWQGQTFSYGDLERRANAVAAALLARDLPPETPVGVALPRSPDLIATVLGVLKAGCTYVPLDPAYPAERIGFIMEDARLRLIIGRGGADDLDPASLPDAPRPAHQGRAGHAAVVIYTSGSTGRPKGVVLAHRNLLSRMVWAAEVLDATELSGMFFATSISFDLSLFELFAPLCNGGRVVLAETMFDLARLHDAGVKIVNTVPSVLREFLDHHALPASVSTIMLAGEPFPPALLSRLRTLPQITRIHSLYGPCEDSIYDAGEQIDADHAPFVPVGRPFPGSVLHICDRNGALRPRGFVGEILCGGVGLGRGYLNRADETAMRFAPAPFAPDERLYRSGDRGRWRADDGLEVHGRIDTQIKLRGQRIEIAEIETALEAQPEIALAVVTVTGNSSETDRQLVAHLVPDAPITSAELISRLGAHLPRHMIPTLWDLRKDVPRLPNGKVNRKALRAETPPPAQAHIPLPPETDEQAEICRLWAELLNADPASIGIDDDFFARGGHSLLLLQLSLRLQETFGLRLSLGELFRATTPRAQAGLLLCMGPAPRGAGDDDPTAGLSDAEVAALLAQMDET